ncbi:helix-turn-helix domain-containing protein [Weissella confusa]|uniref:helix-turn-helix domain-containing protein n=1 Tax=Weissella confusa TaxID=1583 RepID=UPI0018F1C435|nr:helix-turn-helix domain-containing protein [Weissella confusa]MBJ7623911.1 helix-turn-helix domain-containing protein [Weissella confusa]
MSEEFKGVNYYLNTPAIVAHDNRLKPNAKLFFGEIYSLANIYGDVYISNAALAKRYEMTVDAASRLVGQLVKGADVKIMDRFFRHRELPDSENFSKPGFHLKTA